MAKTKSYWFSHDTDAWSDINIELMMSVYGAEGYGFYWIIVETLSMQDNYKLPVKNKGYLAVLSRRMQTTPEKLSEFIEDCIESFNLFVSDDSFFWSDSLIKRLGIRDNVKKSRTDAVMKRWGNLERFDEFWNAYDKKTAKKSIETVNEIYDAVAKNLGTIDRGILPKYSLSKNTIKEINIKVRLYGKKCLKIKKKKL